MSPVPLGILASARPAGGAKVWTYQGAVSPSGARTNHSFSIPIGTAAADRTVIVALTVQAPLTGNITLDGTPMTVDVNGAGLADTRTLICRLAVASGTTAIFALTTASSSNRVGAGVWTATGGTVSLVASDTNPSGQFTANFSAGADDIAIAATYSASADATWTGVTEQYDYIFSGSSDRYTGGHLVATAPQTISPRVTNTIYPDVGKAAALYRIT